ncbi:serine/threonine protein phosphatase 2A 57 kDa regulatory subunit B' theta isoform-like protein, partial [Tanacetum coccineum]
MIKQILSKVSGKKSKSSKNTDFSGTISPNSTSSSSKRSDYGSGNSRKLVNSDISAPLNPRFSSSEKNFRNGGHVSVSYEALPSFRDVPSSEKQNLFIKK